MNWLTHNLIANMPGPSFLVLFGTVAGLTALACWSRARQIDSTASLPSPLIPAQPDPYEIAYLRGGENEVIRAAIVSLTHRRYLQVSEVKTGWSSKELRVSHVSTPPELNHLCRIEQEVYAWFRTPRGSAEIFESGSPLLTEVKASCASYDKRLKSEQLLTSDEMKAVGRKICNQGGAVVVGLGGYKLLVALSKGHSNVQFLIYISIFALVLLEGVCIPARLTQRGKEYLDRLQTAFRPARALAFRVPPLPTDTTLALAVAAYGIDTLADTPLENFKEVFRKADSAAAGVGCGGGCGGGGCGGCGG
jgi:uncharacterized protein (TIGR04222 family)